MTTTARTRRRGPAIPADLHAAIVAAVPSAEVPKLIARWAIALTELTARDERIRAQVTARGAAGFIRHYDAENEHAHFMGDAAMSANPKPSARSNLMDAPASALPHGRKR
jgi:hypothetical protein